MTSARLSQARAEGWAKTGVVSLLNEGLDAVPEATWQVGHALRALELSGNRLTTLPARDVAQLHSLRVLRLSGNQLTAVGLPWAELPGCTSLLTLVLDSNPCVAARNAWIRRPTCRQHFASCASDNADSHANHAPQAAEHHATLPDAGSHHDAASLDLKPTP